MLSYGLAALVTTTHLIWITIVGYLILVGQSIIIVESWLTLRCLSCLIYVYIREQCRAGVAGAAVRLLNAPGARTVTAYTF